MAKFTGTLTIEGKPALIGSVESDFATNHSKVEWRGNLKLLPYPMPICNAPTVEALLGNLAREHGGTVESTLEGVWNDESDVICDWTMMRIAFSFAKNGFAEVRVAMKGDGSESETKVRAGGGSGRMPAPAGETPTLPETRREGDHGRMCQS